MAARRCKNTGDFQFHCACPACRERRRKAREARKRVGGRKVRTTSAKLCSGGGRPRRPRWTTFSGSILSGLVAVYPDACPKGDEK